MLCQHVCKHAGQKVNWVCEINALISNNKDFDWDYVFSKSKKLICSYMLYSGLMISHLTFDTELPDFVLKKIYNLKKINQNTQFLTRNIFKNRELFNFIFYLSKENKFYITTISNYLDKLKLAFQRFKVTPLDWELNIPISLYYLYYLYIPVRLLKKKYFVR
ncbi:MAG: hypothetical protein GTO02_17050 [Candidatus Dadabacteria bacterium]|nr:hypothetical protein [Candidatus Dadabacteria bacterium]NIQ16034.1 hypothetical protein [Candidatus Dadabacteria bacterium]